jgi:ribosomal protein L2
MFKVALKHFIYDTAIAVFMDIVFKNFSTPEKLIQIEVDDLKVGDLIHVVSNIDPQRWFTGYVRDIQYMVEIDAIETSAGCGGTTAFNPTCYFIYKI